MQTIKERLTYARKLRGYTQEALAAETQNVTRSMIANIEADRWRANPIAVKELSNILNVEFEWLMHGNGPMERGTDRERLLEELQEACSRLTESQQLYLLDQIRLMQKHNLLIAEHEEKTETKALMDIIQDAEDRKPTVSPGTGRNRDKEI